jgi:hypothetical protein
LRFSSFNLILRKIKGAKHMSMNVQGQNSFETLYNLTCEVAQNVWDSPFSKLSLITGLGLLFIGPIVLVSVPLSGYVGWNRVKMIRLQKQIDINIQITAAENKKRELLDAQENKSKDEACEVRNKFQEAAARTSMCIRWTVFTSAVVIAYIWRHSFFTQNK